MKVSEVGLADIRNLYESVESAEDKEMVKNRYSIELWERAMRAG
ncbi:hypothetical protein [Phormidesmis priestleyi]|nr:hypothetical protein [Phormidesmis priestleyi]